MINTDRNIFTQETEIKPNRYALNVLTYTLIGNVICLISNEVGLFRVPKNVMRIGSLIPFIIVVIPLIVVSRNKKLLSNHKTKYFILVSSVIVTLTVTTLLIFHTTIMLLYPLFVAALYRSEKMGRIAVTGSIFCTIVSPLLSYALNLWDIELFKELIFIQSGFLPQFEIPEFIINAQSIKEIIIYLIFPRMIQVGAFSILQFHNIHLGQDHVKTQIELNRINQHDALTGLYNQNCYKEFISSNEISGQVGVIFFDVNGLKEANDSKGHEYGDLLLKQCASSINRVLDEEMEYAFRVGGDEFVVITKDSVEEHIQKKMGIWKKALDEINEENVKAFNGLNCSMASGYSIGDFKDIEDLVYEADQKMYTNKTAMKKQ